MQESTLSVMAAVLLFSGNLLVVVLVVLVTSLGGFTKDQEKLLLLVIAPMTAPSMTAAFRYFLKKSPPDAQSREMATFGEKVFGLGPLILFPAILSATILAKAFNVLIREFDSLLTDIAVIEGVFGGIVALVTQRFFKHEE